jgi:hypothetical protein
MTTKERIFELLTASPLTAAIVGDPEHSEYLLVEITRVGSPELNGAVAVYQCCGLGTLGYIGIAQGKPRVILLEEIEFSAMGALILEFCNLLAPKLVETVRTEADWLMFAQGLYALDDPRA